MVKTRTTALAPVAFWVFVTVLYAGQIWWLSRQPGEHINVRGALAWQASYYLYGPPSRSLSGASATDGCRSDLDGRDSSRGTQCSARS